ncbi:hypothetical protein [Formosa sp. PL04]|uniref:hypothetical protein n=1 Tax=Formosa sp. PL04 TaxID=3081755 RepID=UPI002980B433|nr:hypothetical protein [Formosa sp. PL04]MDW5289618.1 hypothetical protein [Formosa sp. PL04]
MKKEILTIVLLTIFCFTFQGCKEQTKKELKSENTSIKIDTLLTPIIGGIKQVVEIKTDDSNKPILLFLSGGPGSSMINIASNYTNILKQKFTIV